MFRIFKRKKWANFVKEGREVHTIPLNDKKPHDQSDMCLCDPTVEPVETRDGTINWLVIHNSFDQREAKERR